MPLQTKLVQTTLELANELGLLDDHAVRDVMSAFAPAYPLASAIAVADSMHVHVKVDDVAALPDGPLRAAGGAVENQKEGYIKYAFPSGMNLIFSSIAASEDDLRETAASRRARPFLDHYGIDIREESPTTSAIFEAVPTVAKELGVPHAAQGGAGKSVFCCHTSVAAKHWVFPKGEDGRVAPSIEVALGPLTVEAGKSGCDLRPADPSLSPPRVSLGAVAPPKCCP